MKILLDTNIIVDIISRRNGYEKSLELLKCCEDKKFNGFITTTTITDIMYILRKHSPQLLRNAMINLMKVLETAEVSRNDIHLSFLSDMPDFEDGVQACCGFRYEVEYIITKNLTDFEFSPIKAISPKDFLLLHG